jgi:hypothetical protein
MRAIEHGRHATKTYVALPYCADDGCVPLIEIVDLTNSRELKVIRLVEQGQFYFTCRWVSDVPHVGVEADDGIAPVVPKRTHQFPVGDQ